MEGQAFLKSVITMHDLHILLHSWNKREESPMAAKGISSPFWSGCFFSGLQHGLAGNSNKRLATQKYALKPFEVRIYNHIRR